MMYAQIRKHTLFSVFEASFLAFMRFFQHLFHSSCLGEFIRISDWGAGSVILQNWRKLFYLLLLNEPMRILTIQTLKSMLCRSIYQYICGDSFKKTMHLNLMGNFINEEKKGTTIIVTVPSSDICDIWCLKYWIK